MTKLADKIEALWCAWTHGGGIIERDEQDRINWRCAKCGRWSDNPVPRRDEAATVSTALRAREASK